MSVRPRSVTVALAAVALLFALMAVAEQPAGVRQLADGNTAFALDLYGKVRAQKGNVFLSPYSVSSALAMTYAGARGETAAEMARTLRFSLRPDHTHRAFQALQGSLARSDGAAGVQLHIANSLWPRTGCRLEPPFTSLLKTHYGVTVTPLDFARATEAARRTINGWVEGRTQQKIKDLIGRGVLGGDTELVLVNAVYFKGSWAGKFDPRATTNEDFAVGGAIKARVPTMHRTGAYGYAKAPGAALLELRYADKRTSMVVLLPDNPNGLAATERQLTPANLKAWLGALREQEVAVALPRFKLVWGTHELNSSLMALGMTRAFGAAADFSGMARSGGIAIGPVLHKAFVDVNEEGTEAAAATAVVMTRGVAHVQRFQADRPFLFLIGDRETGTVLFMGRVLDPRPSAK